MTVEMACSSSREIPLRLDGISLPWLYRSAAPPTLILVPVREHTKVVEKVFSVR